MIMDKVAVRIIVGDFHEIHLRKTYLIHDPNEHDIIQLQFQIHLQIQNNSVAIVGMLIKTPNNKSILIFTSSIKSKRQAA